MHEGAVSSAAGHSLFIQFVLQRTHSNTSFAPEKTNLNATVNGKVKRSNSNLICWHIVVKHGQ